MTNTANTYELYRTHYIANEDHPDYPAQEELISSGFTKPQVDAMMKSFRNSDDITGKVDTDGGYPFVEVTACNGDKIWLDLQDFKALEEEV